MCNYCSGEVPLCETSEKLSSKGDFYPGISAEIDGKTLCIIATADVYEPNYLDADISINYCPICGRKL